MHTGHYISGGGHLALLLWVLFGSVFSSEPDAVEVREVSVVSEEEFAAADAMIGYARRYFERFIEPTKKFRAPTDKERAALEMLSARLKEIGEGGSEDEYQTAVFDAGKAQDFENIRDWFKGLYEVVFGQEAGPRMGPFTKIYGAAATAKLIDEALAR